MTEEWLGCLGSRKVIWKEEVHRHELLVAITIISRKPGLTEYGSAPSNSKMTLWGVYSILSIPGSLQLKVSLKLLA